MRSSKSNRLSYIIVAPFELARIIDQVAKAEDFSVRLNSDLLDVHQGGQHGVATKFVRERQNLRLLSDQSEIPRHFTFER